MEKGRSMKAFARSLLNVFLHRVPLGWVRPLIDACDALGKLAILAAIVWWFVEIPDRADQRHSAAWALLNSAQGKTGNGGRTSALQSLNGDGVSLAGLDLSNANLAGIDLRYADLSGATFRATNLAAARFGCSALGWLVHRRCTDLGDASFMNAYLSGADFRRVTLTSATFAGQKDRQIDAPDFSGSLMADTRFEDLTFFNADFSKTILYRARFVNVIFQHEAIYSDEELFDGAELHDVDFSLTNLGRQHLRKAKLCNVKLPDGNTVNQNCGS
jgi:uncharacterized protein YjbI with pentapeptide repeats